MFGLSRAPCEADALVAELPEDGVQRARGNVEARLDGVVAIHQHLGLDDRNEPRFLRQRGVARQRVGVRPDRVLARPVIPDCEHRAPLGKARAELAVLRESLAQAVEALRDRLAWRQRERLRARVDLDAGEDPALLEQPRERRSIRGRLVERLVEQDHAGDPRLDASGGEEELTVCAPVLPRSTRARSTRIAVRSCRCSRRLPGCPSPGATSASAVVARSGVAMSPPNAASTASFQRSQTRESPWLLLTNSAHSFRVDAEGYSAVRSVE